PGLFGCYGPGALPRTNNDLEHLFGSHRYHERRASRRNRASRGLVGSGWAGGRKRASAGLVVSGSARVLSGLATRLRPDEGLKLTAGYVGRWRQWRAQLEKRREARRRQ